MNSLRRPIIYQGAAYPDYEIDFNTSQVHSVRKNDKVLKANSRAFSRYVNVCPYLNSKMTPMGVHTLMAETFHDLLPKSPLVSYYGLLVGRDRHILKTPTEFTFICNQVCPDHIDGDPSNNHHSNLMIVTQLENNLKRGPKREGFSPHKGVTSDRGKFKARIDTKNTIDQNGKAFSLSKNLKTEEEAALRYNKILEESLFTIWGKDLGPKMYDLAYKNVI
tara:strand:- start:355 stop:1014 length:660 start_codon:yes stop_codon:yes gene_type:complete